jgi:parvulin-like peptidyl-prolyl isomerase
VSAVTSRKFAAVSSLLIASATLPACATFDRNDAAATVNGVEISNDQVSSLAAAGAQDGLSSQAPAIVEALVRNELSLQFLDERGIEVTDTELADLRSQLEAQPEWQTTPPAVQDALVEINAVNERFRGQFVNSDQARQTYEAQGVSSGVACVSHILLATEDEANAVLDRLDAGESFEALAAELSTDPGSAQNGGAYPCEPTDQWQGAVVPEYVNGAVSATVGVPTEPVQSQFGYHVMLVRPYEADAATIDQALGFDSAAYQAAVAGFGDGAVTIDSRYGRWDSATGTVVPMDS